MPDEYPRLKALLLKHEGLRLKVYDDATGKELKPGDKLIGHPTIGIGRALDVNGISSIDAMRMLSEDIDNVVVQCFQAFPWFAAIGATRQDVVASMVFQMGIGGFQRFSQMIAALQAQDYERAAGEMLDSAWAKQAPLRAQELSEMMLRGN